VRAYGSSGADPLDRFPAAPCLADAGRPPASPARLLNQREPEIRQDIRSLRKRLSQSARERQGLDFQKQGIAPFKKGGPSIEQWLQEQVRP
jgi:hypothetical protein